VTPRFLWYNAAMRCLWSVLAIALSLIACAPETATNIPAPSLIEAVTPVGTQDTPETVTNVPSASPHSRPDAPSSEAPGTPQPDSSPAPPSGSPSSAALPDELLARGLERREAGDYDAAAEAFFAAANAAPGTPTGRAARFYLAESFALRERWTSAVEALNAFVADGIQDDLTARAWFWIARGHEEAGSHAAAVAAYEQFRSFATPAEAYARLRQAAQERALGRLDAAAANYEAVARSDLARSQRAAAYEAAIQVRRDLRQIDGALQLANELLTLAEQPAYRARLLIELADLPYSQGDLAQRAPG
jgi:soluble lytic murein transglycosylase